MAMNVKFLKGTLAQYTAATKNDNTFYYLTDKKALYLGANLIGDGVSLEQFSALEARVKTLEDWKAALPEYVTKAVYDAHLTAQDARDDGQDELIAGLRKDLNDITEVGGEPNKVNDVTVDGTSVVTNKVAALKKLAGKDTVATADIDNEAVTKEKLAGAVKTEIQKGVDAYGYFRNEGDKITVGGDLGSSNEHSLTIQTTGGVYYTYYDANKGDYASEKLAYESTVSSLGNDYDHFRQQLTIDYDDTKKEILLKDVFHDNAILGTISADDFIKDGMISSVALVQEDGEGNKGQFLKIEWNDDGKDVTYVDVTTLVDVYTGQDGIVVTSDYKVGHTNKIAAGAASGSTGSIAFGGTIDIPVINYDANGHITSINKTTVTLPTETPETVYTADETTLTKTGTEFKVKDGGIGKNQLAKEVTDDIAAGVAAKTVTDTIGDYVKKTDAPGYGDIWTETEHNAFVEAKKDVLNSGITATKVSEYDATKTTVDTNKETWDKAGTAVQPEDLGDLATVDSISRIQTAQDKSSVYVSNTINQGGEEEIGTGAVHFADSGAGSWTFDITEGTISHSLKGSTLTIPSNKNDTIAVSGDVSAAEGRAAADATSKANTAEANAKADATSKANTAEANAEAYADRLLAELRGAASADVTIEALVKAINKCIKGTEETTLQTASLTDNINNLDSRADSIETSLTWGEIK